MLCRVCSWYEVWAWCSLNCAAVIVLAEQVNYLSALFLTLELLPNILEAAATGSVSARIVFVASSIHHYVSWESEKFSPVEDGYYRLKTYALTKMYNVRIE